MLRAFIDFQNGIAEYKCNKDEISVSVLAAKNLYI